MKLADFRKGVAAVAAGAAQIIALNVLDGEAQHVVQIVAAVAGAVLVVLVPNGTAAVHQPEHAAH